EPFFTTRSAGEGTGLGLAISQGLAESMDGSLEYVGDDGGAVFRLRLH
ncbi:MAG TPA: ATP-binding protein, partial [Enhygromyxa sp.]|nr:ATP-binding protein [Enhygromyxa sp.]